jgi:F-type H+-transporting ATPase subunit epsilon
VKPLILHLESATQYERIENVVSFIGEDDSGSFGILPGHARLLTVLTTGLARFRVASGPWEFIALPGAVLYCHDNELHVCARRYLRDVDYERIGAALREQLQTEEQALQQVRQRLRRLEEEMLKRLWRLRRQGETLA